MKKKKASSLTRKLRNIIEGKGFYIALASLILLVGFAIYAQRAQIKNQTDTVSFDDEAWQAALKESGVEFHGTQPSDDKQDTPQTDASPPDTSSPSDETTPSATDSETRPIAIETATPALPQPNPEDMQMPCSGEIVSECSLDNLVYCATMDDWRTHNGLDIAATEGTPVRAAACGIVSEVYDDPLLGIVVKIDHGSDIASLYANLQSADFIHVGTEVLAGDIIGGIGKPGELESNIGPHLHFEVYKNGELQDPFDFINR